MVRAAECLFEITLSLSSSNCCTSLTISSNFTFAPSFHITTVSSSGIGVSGIQHLLVVFTPFGISCISLAAIFHPKKMINLMTNVIVFDGRPNAVEWIDRFLGCDEIVFDFFHWRFLSNRQHGDSIVIVLRSKH